MADEVIVLSPVGQLGYGFPERSLHLAMQRKPDVIAVDSGSTDPGPYYYGVGVPFVGREMLARDLELLLSASLAAKIPLIVGSAGGGSARQMEAFLGILKDVLVSLGVTARVAVIQADIDPDFVKSKIRTGAVEIFETGTALTEQEVDNSTTIVAQMGVEPIIEALDHGVDLVIAGRAYDPAVFAAFPIKAGFDPALCLHAGLIIECGAKVAEPMYEDCILARIRRDCFILETPNPEKSCRAVLTAAHSFFENRDALYHDLPGGTLDVSELRIEQQGDMVRVSGAKFRKASNYKVKLEGVAPAGYRTVCFGGIRDPYAVARVDEIVAYAEKKLLTDLAGKIDPEHYWISTRLYGKNGVLGEAEPEADRPIHEIGILVEVIGATQHIANTACALFRSAMLHAPYEGRKANAGNIAFPFSPAEHPLGQVFRFNIYHLIQLNHPCEVFPIQIMEVGP